jgi:hypothetical protein
MMKKIKTARPPPFSLPPRCLPFNPAVPLEKSLKQRPASGRDGETSSVRHSPACPGCLGPASLDLEQQWPPPPSSRRSAKRHAGREQLPVRVLPAGTTQPRSQGPTQHATGQGFNFQTIFFSFAFYPFIHTVRTYKYFQSLGKVTLTCLVTETTLYLTWIFPIFSLFFFVFLYFCFLFYFILMVKIISMV